MDKKEGEDMLSDAPDSEVDTIEMDALLLEEALSSPPNNPSVSQITNKNMGKHAQVSCAKKIRPLQTIYKNYPNNYHKNICLFIFRGYSLKMYYGKDNYQCLNIYWFKLEEKLEGDH